MVIIEIRAEVISIIDDIDKDLKRSNWRIYRGRNTLYLQRHEKPCIIHRIIMERILGRELTENETVDHIDGNGLNNQRKNLRLASNTENVRYQRIHSRTKPKSSKYKGVVKHKNKWRARIQVGEKRIHLGLFDSEIDAAMAYDEAAKKYFGEFAYVNFGDNNVCN